LKIKYKYCLQNVASEDEADLKKTETRDDDS